MQQEYYQEMEQLLNETEQSFYNDGLELSDQLPNLFKYDFKYQIN